jgi:acyl-CoA synthetase (AMP-forming)/AMP-acid ligase II
VSGWIHASAARAVALGPSTRVLYAPETTLSRRGLLERADRRARELAGLGLRAGDVLALCLGNVVDLLVLTVAASKLGAVIMPVDAANGDRPLREALARRPTRLVVRRPRGLEAAPLELPPGYVLRSRRQPAGALWVAEVLDPPGGDPPPEGVEVIVAAVGADAVAREVWRRGETLEAIGRSAAALLGLDASTRLVCMLPLTTPSLFDAAVLGWLASPAALAIGTADGPDTLLALARTGEARRIVGLESASGWTRLCRSLAVADGAVELAAFVPGPLPMPLPVPATRARLGRAARELWHLEETGLLGARDGDGEFTLPPGVALERAPDGEIVARTAQAGVVAPAVPAGHIGARRDDGAVWTGWRGDLDAGGRPRGAPTRTDALVHLDGRRVSLLEIERAIRSHPRITWAEVSVEVDADGEARPIVRYSATGTTELEDLAEHAVGGLPPYLVPRRFERVPAPG